MYKLNILARKLGVIAVGIFSALLDTLAVLALLLVGGGLAAIVLPVMSWVGTAVLVKAKLKMVR